MTTGERLVIAADGCARSVALGGHHDPARRAVMETTASYWLAGFFTFAATTAATFIGLLASAKDGWSVVESVAADPALAELRQWPEYVDILAGVKANAARTAAPIPKETKAKK